jgi:hypothetical protein
LRHSTSVALDKRNSTNLTSTVLLKLFDPSISNSKKKRIRLNTTRIIAGAKPHQGIMSIAHRKVHRKSNKGRERRWGLEMENKCH